MDFSDLEMSDSVCGDTDSGYAEISGRVRYIFPEYSIVLLADETGFIFLRVPEIFDITEFKTGYVCVAIGKSIVKDETECILFLGERVFLKNGSIKLDSFSPGYLPFSLVSYLGWFRSEIDTIDYEDGIWIEETVYQDRPWWNYERLSSIHRIDFIYDWEMNNGELPEYIEESISNTEDLG